MADARSADEIVGYYDPTDVFGDLADALAEAYPAIAPELAAAGRRRRTATRRRGRRRRGSTTTPTADDGRRPRPRPTGRAIPARDACASSRAELVESREILPGQWLQAFHAPELATGARAGQFVHVRTGDYSGSCCAGRSRSTRSTRRRACITIHFRTIGRGTEWFTRLRPGDAVDMLGPLGPAVRGGPAVAAPAADRRRPRDRRRPYARRRGDPRRPPGDAAVRGARRARDVYPSSLLPDEVEYVVATDDGSVGPPRVRDRARPGVRGLGRPGVRLRARCRCSRRSPGSPRRGGSGWASRSSGGSAAAASADPVGSPAARRKAFLQVSMEQNMGCAVGACLGCVVMATSGHAAAGLPRGAGVRLGRARLGGRLVKAKFAAGTPAVPTANGEPGSADPALRPPWNAGRSTGGRAGLRSPLGTLAFHRPSAGWPA